MRLNVIKTRHAKKTKANLAVLLSDMSKNKVEAAATETMYHLYILKWDEALINTQRCQDSALPYGISGHDAHSAWDVICPYVVEISTPSSQYECIFGISGIDRLTVSQAPQKYVTLIVCILVSVLRNYQRMLRKYKKLNMPYTIRKWIDTFKRTVTPFQPWCVQ